MTKMSAAAGTEKEEKMSGNQMIFSFIFFLGDFHSSVYSAILRIDKFLPVCHNKDVKRKQESIPKTP